jgi:hypothetical protein
MYDPGADRHEWESEMAALDEELRDDSTSALPQGDEREVVSEFLAAREIKDASERG